MSATPTPAADQSLPSDRVVGLGGDAWLESGFAAGGGERGDCGSVPDSLDLGVVGELGEVDPFAVREAVLGGQCDVQAVLGQPGQA